MDFLTAYKTGKKIKRVNRNEPFEDYTVKSSVRICDLEGLWEVEPEPRKARELRLFKWNPEKPWSECLLKTHDRCDPPCTLYREVLDNE